MHSHDTKTQFIELRARGRTIRDIAKQLNVPTSTLGVWNREHRPDINRLRALQWEELEDQFSRTLEDDLKALAARIRKWEDELDTLDPCYHKVSEMIRVISYCRREYDRRRAILMAPLDEPTRLLPLPEAPPVRDLRPDPQGRSEPSEALSKEPGRCETEFHSTEPTSGKPSSNPTPSAAVHDPTELYKIVRSPESAPTPPHNTNDLQQPPPTPSNSVDSVPPPDAPVGRVPPRGAAQLPGSPDDFVGSIVYNPVEPAQALIHKCLEAERAHRENSSHRPHPSPISTPWMILE